MLGKIQIQLSVKKGSNSFTFCATETIGSFADVPCNAALYCAFTLRRLRFFTRAQLLDIPSYWVSASWKCLLYRETIRVRILNSAWRSTSPTQHFALLLYCLYVWRSIVTVCSLLCGKVIQNCYRALKKKKSAEHRKTVRVPKAP